MFRDSARCVTSDYDGTRVPSYGICSCSGSRDSCVVILAGLLIYLIPEFALLSSLRFILSTPDLQHAPYSFTGLRTLARLHACRRKKFSDANINNMIMLVFRVSSIPQGETDR